MIDSALFTSGSLFSSDYLVDAITVTAEYRAVDVDAVRAQLLAIATPFPRRSDSTEAQTEDDFIWPVLSALGFTESLRQQNLTVSGRDDVPDGLLFADADGKAAANALPEAWRRYSHGIALVESKRWDRPLDRATGRNEATAPSTQMLRYLRRVDDITGGKLRWGILTNGSRWRLYWSGARSVSEEFLEIDLERVLALKGEADLFATEADRDHWLRVFAVMFARTAFLKSGADDKCFHERARAAAAFYEERVAKNLSRLVFDSVFPSLAAAIARQAPDAALQDVREASLVLLYRLLFMLYAEDRDLLPVSDKRYDDYALRPLRIDTAHRVGHGDAFSASAARIWSHIHDLARIIDRGDQSVGIPPYNGGLFSSTRTPLLETIRIPDDIMAPALDALSFDRSSGDARYINYRDLSVQQLGSIYERLLEFEICHEEDGSIAVRPNLFARKNSGSYYTPDELVGLILDETLEPLITDRLEAFRSAVQRLEARDSDDFKRGQLRAVDPAQAILGLRVCDPAMGSGHFLVSLVDTLADHVLDAMAEAASLPADLDYTSPLAERILDIRTTIANNARAANWTIDEGQLDDRHIVRRMVLKRCVYGVDKNPMAVELAKVALWLHTFTVGAPLSFVDHHLAAGDSLFGLWVRDAIDKADRLGGALLWNDALRNAQAQAQAMKTIEMATDAEIAEAHRSAEMWEGVEAQTGPLDSFVSFMHALDWLNLSRAQQGLVRLWLDGRFGEPIPIARGTRAPEGGKAKAEEVEAFTAIWSDARALIAEERFLNWQIAFPGVWDNWASAERVGGFDAVVGNPPWDMMEFEEVPWFEARDNVIAQSPNRATRRRRMQELESTGATLWNEFKKASYRAEQATRIARQSKNFGLLNIGRINIFKLFVERAYGLVKPDGMVGLLVPSGIASDLSAARFFKKVATGSHLKSLFDFENRRTRHGLEPFFPDVDSRFKFCAIILSPERKFPSSNCAFYLQSIDELENPEKLFTISSMDFSTVNPNTGTAPNFRSKRDMTITTDIYARQPVLLNKSGDVPVQHWPTTYVQMLNMSIDSHSFHTRQDLEEKVGAWRATANVWTSSDATWLPLYEGKMINGFDHRAANVTNDAETAGHLGQHEVSDGANHADPSFSATPRYWVASTPELAPASIGFRDIARATDARTIIAAMLPHSSAGHTLPLIQCDCDVALQACLLANLNSIPLDFVARQKVQSTHVSWYIVEQLPVVPPSGYTRAFGPKTAADIVREIVLELTYTAHDMAPFARDMGHVDAAGEVLPPFIWDEDRRLRLRAKLDALYFILYGVYDPADAAQSRDDIRYIYSTFPIVEREEIARWGSYRSRDLCLAWINALVAGQPDAEPAG